MIFAKELSLSRSLKITFLVDTGAEINAIKKRYLYPNIRINTDDIITIIGITERKIETISSITIIYCEYEI